MRIVVTGATGNVGTAVLRALTADERVQEIVGIARRLPGWNNPRTRWVSADVAADPLVPHFEGADAVVHLAWLIQPSRDLAELERVNVEGSRRVFDAAAAAGAGALVHASSVGAYSPGPKDRRVGESWPTGGIETSFYSRHKAAAERLLDAVEARHPELRVVRLRPGLIFQRTAAQEIRRLFAGPLLPSPLVHPRLLPLLPVTDRLVLQVVHADDVGQAYRLAATDPEARGAYNIAAEPLLGPRELGDLLGARPVRVPARALRAAAEATWRAHLQPTPPGWLDMGLGVPAMDIGRARAELGWAPAHGAGETLLELLDGLRRRDGGATPPLDAAAGGPLRVRELRTGVGRVNP
jgi:nucleoside-diphosphate-sugar epimerase